MNHTKDYRDTRFPGVFDFSITTTSSVSHHTKCKREELQHTATTATSYRRPRPGRRRLSMNHLPLSLSRIFLFITVTLSVLCMPVKAKEKPFPQLRAVQGYFADGMILYDHDAAPQPALHRREDAASTATTSTNAAAVAFMTSSNSVASPTTTSLPRAFDGGFGTNYTQPSCPTFLRSMVNNDTFMSCLPFSLLLQVRQTTSPPQQSIPPPALKLIPSPELHVLLRRNPLRRQHLHRPQRLLLRRLPHLLGPHVRLHPDPALLHRLPRRLQLREPAGAPSLRRPPRLRRLLQRLLPQKHPPHKFKRPPARQHKLLLRQRRHQHHFPHGFLHLLPPPRHPPPAGESADVRQLSCGYDGRVCECGQQSQPAPQSGLCRCGQYGQCHVRAYVCECEYSRRRVRDCGWLEEVCCCQSRGRWGCWVDGLDGGAGWRGGFGGWVVMGGFGYFQVTVYKLYTSSKVRDIGRVCVCVCIYLPSSSRGLALAFGGLLVSTSLHTSFLGPFLSSCSFLQEWGKGGGLTWDVCIYRPKKPLQTPTTIADVMRI